LNVASTTKPRRATSSAGFSKAESFCVPQRLVASSQSAGVPGTPTDRPELTTVAKSSGLPSGPMNVVGVNVAGADSRPSMVCTSPDLAS